MFSEFSARILQIEQHLSAEGEPYSLEMIELTGQPRRIYRFGPKTLTDLCNRGILVRPSMPFIHFGDAEQTYGIVFQKVVRFSSFFRERKLGPGQKVCIALPNIPEAFALLLAVTSLGAVAVLAGKCSQESAIETAERLCCEILVYAASDSFSDIEISWGRPIRHDRFSSFAELVALTEDCRWEPTQINPDTDAIVAFTSGSTGRSKAVVLSHRAITTGLMNMLLAGAMANGSRVSRHSGIHPKNTQPGTLLLLPYYHIGGFTQLMLQLLCGGRVVVENTLSVENIAAAIEQFGTRSVVGLMPRQARTLLHLTQEYDLSALATVNFSGASLSRGILRSFAAGLPNVIVGTSYGMTETCGALCALAGESLAARSESSGRVVPAVDVKIVDNTGCELPCGQIGEICVSGEMLFRTYWDNDDLANKNGWFSTGDFGYLTSDRHLCVSDRWGKIGTYKAGQIPCAQIEDEICDAFDLDEVAVLPTEVWSGECPVLVATISSAASIDVTKYRDYLMRHIGQELPLVLIPELPRTASGKIDRVKLSSELNRR